MFYWLKRDDNPRTFGSSIGGYLSAVSTDSSMAGNGTVSDPLSAAPLTGQSAPTTATPGYLGEVRFDTDGNEWKLIKIDGSTYYWSPVGFPAVNTNYPAYVENGILFWKRLHYAENTGSSLLFSTSPGIDNIDVSKSYLCRITLTEPVNNGRYTIGWGSSAISAQALLSNVSKNIVVYQSSTFYNSKLEAELYYTTTA